MREVKDSGIEWIGQIPKDWEIAPLRRYAVSKTGMTPSKNDTSLWEGIIPWASPKDLKSDHLSDTEDHISEEALENNSLELIEAGSVIICVRSGILRHTFPVAINDVPMTINQDLRALTFASNINPSFVLYYFLGMNESILALTRKIGATVESIEMEWLMNFPLILIPRNEQETTKNEQDVIVDYLDAKCAEIDKVIKAKEALNEKLREYRQSVIYEAVTKGLDKNAKMKDSGIEWIGQIPKDWEIAPLRRYAVSKTGMTPSKDDTSLWEGIIPWASPKDLKSDHLSDTEDHISEEALENNSLELIEAGSVIICVRSGILRHTFPVAINDVPMTINQDLRALTFASNINPSFVLYYFLGMNESILALTRKIGATVESIEMEWLMNFPLILIPRNEQETTKNEQDVIVDYLDAKCAEIDSVISANDSTIQKLKEYRKSVIYEAVTGKTDVISVNKS